MSLAATTQRPAVAARQCEAGMSVVLCGDIPQVSDHHGALRSGTISAYEPVMTLRLGNHQLDALEGGRFALDGGAMFGLVPRPLWERKIPPDERNRIPQ